MKHATTTAIGLTIALVAPPLFAIVPPRLFGSVPSLRSSVVLQLLYCGLVPLIVWIVVRWERLPLSSIGMRGFRWSSIGWALVLWLLIGFVLPQLTGPMIVRFGSHGLQAGLQALSNYPEWFLVVVGATGGVIEETLYRGYAVERLVTLTGREWLGGAIVVAIFTLAHVPMWGLGFALAADLPFAVVMTAFYLWRRDLVASALAHSVGLMLALPAAVGN